MKSTIAGRKIFPTIQQQVNVLAEENALLNTPDKNLIDPDMKTLNEINVLREF